MYIFLCKRYFKLTKNIKHNKSIIIKRFISFNKLI